MTKQGIDNLALILESAYPKYYLHKNHNALCDTFNLMFEDIEDSSVITSYKVLMASEKSPPPMSDVIEHINSRNQSFCEKYTIAEQDYKILRARFGINVKEAMCCYNIDIGEITTADTIRKIINYCKYNPTDNYWIKLEQLKEN